MFQGLANGSAPAQQVWGVCVLKGMKDLVSRFGEKYLNPGAKERGMIFYDYDFGGYGKKNPQLFQFMNGFYHQTGIRTDFVYTAKLFYGVIDLVRKGRVSRGSTLLVVHSGGLQGNGSLQPGTLPY
jgi:1-aminocyclopropane-1-carboxylate deaminase/D-cysteine desulfhydrase-like pyridoxal-dependent ACC family enzyme